MQSKKSRIRLYADECFPVPTVTYLKSLGNSIVHAFDKKFVSKSDKFHLKQAKNLARVLITLDRDFIGYEQGSLKDTPGVIVVSVGSATPLSINPVCNKVLVKLTEDFAKGSLIKITKDKIIKIKKGVKTEKII